MIGFVWTTQKFPWRLATLSLVVLVGACAAPPVEKTNQPTAPVQTAPNAVEPPTSDSTNPVPFPDWLEALKAEAATLGLKPTTLQALDNLQLLTKVVELDRKQPEAKASLAYYLANRVTRARVIRGKELLAENRALLEKVAARYGVQPRFIVAFWGMESGYGRVTGGFSVIQSLATLAYDGRRAAYFRGELFKALKIIDSGAIPVGDMKGSWAGAMGQAQFMPSSYEKFAVSLDGQGPPDIWRDNGDVFASIANYLAENGWRKGQGWGREVAVPKGFDQKLASLEVVKSVDAWRALGVTNPDGSKLPRSSVNASIILPPRANDRAFLAYENFKAIRAYNPSHYYAIAIGQLADAIGQ
jgi:membrane-bound lytic murein transglycosylase B